ARLYEYQGKQLLKEAGLTVPRGDVASSPEQAFEIARQIGGPVAIKSQVWTTGRFKAGGIKFANTPEDARKETAALLGSRIKGFLVEKVLVEERLELAKEFYVGIIVDASHKVRAPVMMFTTEGGVDVEAVQEKNIARLTVNIFDGVTLEDARNMVRSVNVPQAWQEALAAAAVSLYEVFRRYDARSAEINPLVVTSDGRVMAADCRIGIDDASVSRHPQLGIEVPRESDTAPTALDKIGWKIEESDYRGISFFAQMATDTQAGGYIGYHAIGGGGALLAADMLVRHGLKLANYAETSGNPPASKVYRTARIVLSQPGLEGYCLMGAVMASQDQWHHALGLVKAFRETLHDKPGFPVVILIAGNKEKESLAIMREAFSGMNIRFELFGREYIHRLSFVANRMKEMVSEYRADRQAAQKPAAAVPAAPYTRKYDFRTGSVRVNENQCGGCKSLACVKACSLYGGYLYRVKNGKMVMGIPLDAVPRQCNECLACEFECRMRGQNALSISLPMEL
ncbi:MAG: acetate--CoA ligase family protein, partial [Planctomycetales bacterium]|nr:acetate--CoA ligase family protein [Planctomycetales bacterium]